MSRIIIWTACLGLLAGGAVFPQDEPKNDNPFQTLLEFGKKLDAGMAAFLKGKSAEEAFPSWKMDSRNREAKLREDLMNAGAVKGGNLGVEFDITFVSEGKGVFRLRTIVSTFGGKITLLQLRYTEGEDVGLTGDAIENLKGDLKRFGEAAMALKESISKNEKPTIAVIDPKDLEKFFDSEEFIEKMRKGLKEAKEKWEEAWNKLRALKFDDVRIRVDDQIFLMLNAEGKAVGLWKNDFDIKDGSLELDLGRLKKIR